MTNHTVILVDFVIITTLHMIHRVSLLASRLSTARREHAQVRSCHRKVDLGTVAADMIQALRLVPALASNPLLDESASMLSTYFALCRSAGSVSMKYRNGAMPRLWYPERARRFAALAEIALFFLHHEMGICTMNCSHRMQSLLMREKNKQEAACGSTIDARGGQPS